MEMNAGTLFSSWILTSPFFCSAGWTSLLVTKYQQLQMLEKAKGIPPSHYFSYLTQKHHRYQNKLKTVVCHQTQNVT